MYSYTKKMNHKKKILVSTLALTLFLSVFGIGLYQKSVADKKGTFVSVNQTSVPVINLPKTKELANRPYKVDAKIVLNYYDGSDSKVPSMTKFEGVYRANQGIDYGFNKEPFDVLAILSGEVIDVKEDPLFGMSCTIKSNDIVITYQSLKDVRLKVGDKVKQGDAISLAGENVYNKDLGNHLHVVVTKKDILINPESIYGKSVEEI